VRHSADGSEITAICVAGQQRFRASSVEATDTDEAQARFLDEARLVGGGKTPEFSRASSETHTGEATQIPPRPGASGRSAVFAEVAFDIWLHSCQCRGVDELLNQLRLLKTTSSLCVLIVLLLWETAAPFLPLFDKQLRERTRHAACNFLLGLINAVLGALAVTLLWVLAMDWAETHQFGLLNWLLPTSRTRLILAVVLFDAWMYWWHRMNHRLLFFWRFHRTHHSDPKMDVTTAHRFHFGEIIFSSLFRVPIILLLGMRLEELVIYETVTFVIVQLHHANVGLPDQLDRLLRLLIVTPAIHKVHHSRMQLETDSNYSSLFSIWDRLFRTLRLRADPRTIRFGLNAFDQPELQTLAGLLKTPMNPNVKRDT
jgi:sterol desaturase/sphingolipid hydroxylase (fatty acid hydroxylase superfamily)